MTPEGRNAPGDGGARSGGESLSLRSYDFGDVELVLMAAGREGKSLICLISDLFLCSHLCLVRGILGGTNDVEPPSQELQSGEGWRGCARFTHRHPVSESKCCVLCAAVPQPGSPLVGDSPGQDPGCVGVSGFCPLSIKALLQLPGRPVLSAMVFLLLSAKLSLLSSH